MKFFTKEIYEMMQHTDLTFGLKIEKRAETFSEEYFHYRYNEDLETELVDKKLKSLLTADIVYPLDKKIEAPKIMPSKDGRQVGLAKELYTEHELEDIRLQMIENNRKLHDSFVPYVYDEKKITNDFERSYKLSLSILKKKFPETILKEIADLRILALGYVSKEVYDKIEAYSLECKRRVKQAHSDYMEYFETIKDHFPQAIIEKYGFHDNEIISHHWNGKDYVIEFEPDFYSSSCKEVRYINAEVLEDEGIDGCSWLYDEFVYNNGKTEYHAMVNGKGLRYLTLAADDIKFTFVTRESASDGLVIRNETPDDYSAVEHVIREAFFNHYCEGCTEHYLAHIMRTSSSFIKELDFAAEINGEIAGSIMYTEAKILCDSQKEIRVLCFGPLAVLPKYQSRGIGSALIKHSLLKAKEMGCNAVLIMGDPNYYCRFGFVPAEKYGIGTADNMYDAALQALELKEGALADCDGRFIEDKVFEIDEAEAEEFDKGFPPKEKISGLPSQKRFETLVSMVKPR